MQTIALINQKGGSGKTTLALHLAVAFTQGGLNTALLDLDPQASAAEWADARAAELPHVESLQSSRLEKRAAQVAAAGADMLILDTAPHAEATALAAARLADLILVPFQPSIMDIRAMVKTAKLLELVAAPAWAVLNAVPHQSVGAGRQAARTIEGALGMAVCPVWLHERVVYHRALIEGLAAQEVEPQGKAAQELRILAAWLGARLQERRAA